MMDSCEFDHEPSGSTECGELINQSSGSTLLHGVQLLVGGVRGQLYCPGKKLCCLLNMWLGGAPSQFE